MTTASAAVVRLEPPATGEWIELCRVSDLEVERGRAALVDDEQIALFLTRTGEVHAVSNRDPYSGANVIARGIVGTRGDAATVASPMFKQVFDLRTGACLQTHGKPPFALRVWPVGVDGDRVLIRAAGS